MVQKNYKPFFNIFHKYFFFNFLLEKIYQLKSQNLNLDFL